MAIRRRGLRNSEEKESLADGVSKALLKPPTSSRIKLTYDKVVSTGSTLLDLAISGKRVRGGGIPGGTVAEFFGPEGTGKTAILAEIVASAQLRGGEGDIQDPEGRLDREYARIYAVDLDEENYSRPDTVTEVFARIRSWKPKNPDVVNVLAVDSLAALSTDLEMGNDDGDKRGQRRAKEFSEGFRKHARIIAGNRWILACSNQIREGDFGETTPGGKAIRFYSSLRVRIRQKRIITLERKLPLPETDSKRDQKRKDAAFQKAIGIESECYVVKSTVDDPYRSAPVYITFGHGVDDIRANLQYLKDVYRYPSYRCPDGRGSVSMEDAIRHVEKEGLQEPLRESVIDLWEQVENLFESNRVGKVRR